MIHTYDGSKRLAASLLPALLFTLPAASEDASDTARSLVAAGASSPESKVPRAPIGHRQPTANDLPKEFPTDATDQERQRRDRELDAKLLICRGC